VSEAVRTGSTDTDTGTDTDTERRQER